MDLVICPSCRFTFSPTPGQAVKCPACMAVITPGASDELPAPRTTPKRRPPRPEKRAWGFVIVSSLFFAILLIGGGLVIAKTISALKNPAPGKNVAEVGQIPDVIVPKQGPGPQAVIPEPAPTVAPESTAKSKAPKVRVLDPDEVRPAPVDVPIDGPKATKTVVRDVPGVTPAGIDAAVKKGAQYLRDASATWFNNDSHRLGYIALGGLTLLECQTSRSEPVIYKAAELTRELAPSNNQTYEITLAILFLDRLGDSRDRELIRNLGARLVAGQDSGGGYGYSCPILTPPETTQLLAFLNVNRPRPAPAPLTIDGTEKGPLRSALQKGADELDPFAEREPDKTIGKKSSGADAPPDKDDSQLISQPPKILPKNRLGANAGTIRLDGGSKDAAGLGPRVKLIPAVANRGLDAGGVDHPDADHSNLQFAVLGLWVARRHGVASDRALLLAEERMRKLQLPEGNWRYKINAPPGSDAMICSGILSLALGHAVRHTHPVGLSNALAGDPHIARAVRRLAQKIPDPEPSLGGKNLEAETYTLWSIERVAVLLNQSTIEGKDWYGWGAQVLIQRQNPDGSWYIGAMHSPTSQHVDTCFALLFLVRSNLVQEITEQIRLQTPMQSK
jgi:hypothetical protein